MVIRIDGIIGYEITAKDFNNQIEQCSGDLEIEINSPGGLVYDGVSIFNSIKNYNKGKRTITVSGESSSIASYIMLAGDELIIEANSSIVIHNPLNGIVGDYQVMRKNADMLEKLAIMLAKTYVAKTTYSLEEIRTMMDEETYFIGSESLQAWGNVIGEQNIENTEIETRAKMAFMAMCDKVKSQNDDITNLNALKMLIDTNVKPVNVNNPQRKGNIKMDLNELKDKHPALYAQVVAEGVTQEKERVSAHLEFIDVAPETSMSAIKDGSNFTTAIQAKYLKAGINKGEIKAMSTESPEDVAPVVDPAKNPTQEVEAKKEAEIRALLNLGGVK